MLNTEIDYLDDDIYEMALKHFGEASQCLKAMEECGELVQALAKVMIQALPNEFSVEKIKEPVTAVIEELADVYIMVEQMAIMFGKDQFEERVFKKTHKLETRIRNELAANEAKI